jgi:hypothetical protein
MVEGAGVPIGRSTLYRWVLTIRDHLASGAHDGVAFSAAAGILGTMAQHEKRPAAETCPRLPVPLAREVLRVFDRICTAGRAGVHVTFAHIHAGELRSALLAHGVSEEDAVD